MIATEEQVEKGIKRALDRVRSPGVFIEGNSFTEFIDLDAFIMVARADGSKSKASARRALSRVSALYLSGGRKPGVSVTELFRGWKNSAGSVSLLRGLPVYTEETMANLIADLGEIYSATTDPKNIESHLDPSTFSTLVKAG